MKDVNQTIAWLYSYDTDNRLRSASRTGLSATLAYDPEGRLRQTVIAGATTTNKNWLYTDHLGSVVATANSLGTSTASYSYGPYGEPNTTGGIRFRYTGQQYLGPLNLYYYKARFYSPTLGRFLQTDPIGYADDMNLYAYVGNDPVNYTDPSGMTSREAKLLSQGLLAGLRSMPMAIYIYICMEGLA